MLDILLQVLYLAFCIGMFVGYFKFVWWLRRLFGMPPLFPLFPKKDTEKEKKGQ